MFKPKESSNFLTLLALGSLNQNKTVIDEDRLKRVFNGEDRHEGKDKKNKTFFLN